MRKFRSRDYSANILASVLLIFMGAAGCLSLILVFAPQDTTAYLLVGGIFGPLALLPLSGLRRASAEMRGWSLARIRNLFRRRKRRQQDFSGTPKMWKRKQTNFVPEPWGNQRFEG